MTKRIFKVIGIVLAGVLALTGVIVGVLAITGKFKSDPIYPARLFFESESVTVEYDETNGGQLHSFRLTAQSDKAKEVNQRTCYIYLDRDKQVDGQDLIILTDSKGQSLTAENDGFYKVNCNEQIYFKVNNTAVEKTYSASKADFGYITISGQARRDGAVTVSTQNKLRINIDIASNKLVLDTPNKDAELSEATQTQNVTLSAGAPLDMNFIVSPNNALLPIVGENAKEIELYFEDTSKGEYTLITQQNCTEYDLEWVGNPGQLGNAGEERNTYRTGYRFLSNSNANKNYNFVAVIYPTYLAKSSDTATWDTHTVYDQHISKLPHLNINISVQYADIESVQIGSSVELNLNLDNEISLNDLNVNMTGAGSEDRYNEITFGIANNENAFISNSNFIFESTGDDKTELSFNNANWKILNGTITDNAGATYTIKFNNKFTIKSNTGVEYQLIDSITAQTGDKTYKAKYGAIFVQTSNGNKSLVLLGSGSYMDFYKMEGDSYITATNSEFDYTIEKVTSGAGLNNSWKIKPTTINETTTIYMFLFVVNSNGNVVMSNNGCQVNVKPVYSTPTRKQSVLNLKMGYNESGRLSQSVSIDALYNLNTENSSYNAFALVTDDTTNIQTVGNFNNLSDGLGTNFYFVGYFEDGKFVNAVKWKNEISISQLTNNTPQLYPILLKTNDISKYIAQETSSIDFIKLGKNGSAIADENFKISVNLTLDIKKEDLTFTFDTDNDEYVSQGNEGIKYVHFGEHLKDIDDNQHTLRITSKFNAQIDDLLALYPGDYNGLISFIDQQNHNVLGDDSENKLNIASVNNGDKQTIEITFKDLVNLPSSTTYYRFAVNVGGDEQIVCDTNIYFVPNSPTDIRLKLNNENIPLATSTNNFDYFPYLKVTIGWDTTNDGKYTYSYKIITNRGGNSKEIEITDISSFFNLTTKTNGTNGFIATPYEKLTRNITYSTHSIDEFDYFTLTTREQVSADVLGVTTENGYTIITITCENVTRYMKVVVDADGNFKVTANDTEFISENTLNLKSENLSYKHGETDVSIGEAVLTGIDDIITGVNKTLTTDIKNIPLNQLANDNVCGIKVDDEYLVKIEWKQVGDNYDLVLTREKYVNTNLQFKLSLKFKTEQQPTTITIKFSPSLSINESQDWDSFYADTTILLYKEYKIENEMASDNDKPLYRILNKSNTDGANKITVKYIHSENDVPTDDTGTTNVENGELELEKGYYKFFFYTTKDGADTQIELDYTYTIKVVDNVVAVLNDSSTISLKSATETQLNSLISLYSYKTDDTIVYGKENSGNVAMYSDGKNLENASSIAKPLALDTDGKFTINGKQNDDKNLLSISGTGNYSTETFKVGWVTELDYDNTTTITLNYNGNPIAIWINNADNLTRQPQDEISINITNAYKVNKEVEDLSTYLNYGFDDVFNVETENTNKTLTIASVGKQQDQLARTDGDYVANNNSDVKFVTSTDQFYAYIIDPNQNEYHVLINFEFDVQGVENGKLTGTFELDLKPYVPETNRDASATYYIESNPNILKDLYSAASSLARIGEQEIDFIESIEIVAIGEHSGFSYGYTHTGENWAADKENWPTTTAGANVDLSRDYITLSGEQATVNLTVQLSYDKDGHASSYEYILPITVLNNQGMKINYPIDTSQQLSQQSITLTKATGGTESATFTNYEIVTLQTREQADQISSSTTIDLANDNLLNLSRVQVWDNIDEDNQNPIVTPLHDATITLYASNTGNISYNTLNKGIEIDGTKITFNVVSNMGNTNAMYFIFRISYNKDNKVVASKDYYIKLVYISNGDKLKDSYYKTNINAGITYSSGQNTIIETTNDDIKLFGTSIKSAEANTQNGVKFTANIDSLMGSAKETYKAENIQFYLVSANYLGGGNVDGLFTGAGEFKIGGLLNGENNVQLETPTDHLTLKIMVIYSNKTEDKFVPIGVLSVYVSPTESEIGHINKNANAKSILDGESSDITTGVYEVNLNSTGIGEFSIIENQSSVSGQIGISSAKIDENSLSSDFALGEEDEEENKLQAIKYNDQTVLTLNGNTIKISNFVESTLKFTVNYVLSKGETKTNTHMKVNYIFNGVETLRSEDSITLGNSYDENENKFKNYLELSNYVPTSYNGNLSFTINNQTSKSLPYLGSENGTLQQENGDTPVIVNSSNVNYEYKDGKLTLSFTQTSSSYTFDLTIKMDNYLTKIEADSKMNVRVTVTPKLHVKFENERTDSGSAYPLTNVNDSEGKFKQEIGSSIYVDVASETNTTTFRIYDADNTDADRLLATIITEQSATLQIKFKDDKLSTSDLVKKLVISKNIDDAVTEINTGELTISKSTTINFAHLASSINLAMDFVVKSGNNQLNSEGSYRYFISVPQTYTLSAVYEMVDSEREIVATNSKYYIKSVDNENSIFKLNATSLKDIADKESGKNIVNKYKLAIKDPNGDKNTFDYDPQQMGFTDSGSVNYLTFGSLTGTTTSGIDTDNGPYISFGDVNDFESASVVISNSAGVSINYNFKIMKNGNGIDKSNDGPDIYNYNKDNDNFNYVSLLVKDEGDTFVLADAENVYGKVIGQVRDGDTDVFYITSMSISANKGGNLTNVTSTSYGIEKKNSEENDVNVKAQYTITQNANGQPMFIYTITFTNDNKIYLNVERTENNSTKLDVTTLQLTMYGNSNIETGFRIYLFNVSQESKTESKEFYGYAGNSINLGDIFKYSYNGAEERSQNVENISYQIDLTPTESWARVSSGQSGQTFELSNVFTKNEDDDNYVKNNMLTLRTMVQDVTVHLQIDVLYTSDLKSIILQKQEFEFTVKRGVSLFFHDGSEYKLINGSNDLIAQYSFSADAEGPQLPYTWDLSTPYTYNYKQYQIVARRLGANGETGDANIDLSQVLSSVSVEGEEENISYSSSNQQITFNKDINQTTEENNANSPKYYNFKFTLLSSGLTFEQTLKVQLTGFVSMDYKNKNIIDNKGNGYNAGVNVNPIVNGKDPMQASYPTAGIKMSVNYSDSSAVQEQKPQLKLHYKQAITTLTNWHSLTDYTTLFNGQDNAGVEITLQNNLSNLPKITLPATSLSDAVVVYQFWLEYTNFTTPGTEENPTSNYYYVSYKLNATNYISGFSSDGEGTYRNVDVDKNLISNGEEGDKTVLPLMYFAQSYTATEVEDELSRLAESASVEFSLAKTDDSPINKQLKINDVAYTFNSDNNRYTSDNGDYYVVDFSDLTLVHFTSAEETSTKDKTYKLSNPQSVALNGGTKLVFNLKGNININDYYIFANELINHGHIKFMPQSGDKIEGATDDLTPETTFNIVPVEVGENVVLGVDLYSINNTLFNGRLNAKLVLELNGTDIQPADNNFSLYTENEIKSVADKLPNTNEIFNLSDSNPIEILGIYNKTNSDLDAAKKWVTANGGEIETAVLSDEIYKSFRVGTTTYNVKTLTYTLSSSSDNSLYTNKKSFYVIESDSDDLLVAKTAYQQVLSQTNAEDNDYITINLSDIVVKWEMQDNKLTKATGLGNLSATITENENNAIKSADDSNAVILDNSNGEIKIRKGALQSYFNGTDGKTNSSVDLRFTIKINNVDYNTTITISGTPQV